MPTTATTTTATAASTHWHTHNVILGKKCMAYKCLTLFHFRLISAIKLDVLHIYIRRMFLFLVLQHSEVAFAFFPRLLVISHSFYSFIPNKYIHKKHTFSVSSLKSHQASVFFPFISLMRSHTHITRLMLREGRATKKMLDSESSFRWMEMFIVVSRIDGTDSNIAWSSFPSQK